MSKRVQKRKIYYCVFGTLCITLQFHGFTLYMITSHYIIAYNITFFQIEQFLYNEVSVSAHLRTQEKLLRTGGRVEGSLAR